MKFILSLFIAMSSAPLFAMPVSIVSHHWITKILDSRNNVTIRPGSVYDIQTYFEQRFYGIKPKFRYIFKDTGLGAAEPIYPIFQKGYQKSWKQVIKGGFSRNHLHIDHYSRVKVPEGCTVHSAYWVRHVNDFPKLYAKEKKEGYTLIDIGFDYYEATKENAKCGKHIAYPPVPRKQNPIRLLKKYAKKFRGYDDIPASILEKLETKIGVLKLVKERFSRSKWPRYSRVYTLEKNSMWYYPGELEKDYGLKTTYESMNKKTAVKASDYFIEATENLQQHITLKSLLPDADIKTLWNHLDGKPTETYMAENEAGNDLFALNQVTKQNIWTSGLKLWPINDVKKMVHNLDHYKLVSIIVRPYEPEPDLAFSERIIPQLRFVFQLVDPVRKRPLEQVYLHVQFDAVDRYRDQDLRNEQHQKFLGEFENLIDDKYKKNPNFENNVRAFVTAYTQRKVQTIAYSSSLTGIWVFGAVSRSFNEKHQLEAVKFERAGIDVGYYSTIWDNTLFRQTIKKSTGKAKKDLQEHMDLLTPLTYRDRKRQDVNSITFNKMTCAQCHQMAGRDGVHVSFNDGTDDRVKTKSRKTEFALLEIERQLKLGQSFWKK